MREVIDFVSYLSLYVILTLLALIALSTLRSLAVNFVGGFIRGFWRSTIESEVTMRVARQLTSTPLLRVGDRMQASGAFLRDIHRLGDYDRVVVEVVSITEADGYKVLNMQNIARFPNRPLMPTSDATFCNTGGKFWKDDK